MSLSDILAAHAAKNPKKVATALPAINPSPATAFNFLLSSLVKKPMSAFGTLNEGYDKDLTPSPCTSLTELIEAVGKKVHLSDSAKDCFAIMLATAISLRIDGPFLWTHIAGPSSSLKSTLLNLVTAAYDKVFSLTEFKGFYSGSTVGGKDNSLLPQLQDKLFVIHDFTPIIQGKADVQNEVCTQFRVIYDGRGEAYYKNGVMLDYKNVRFACLTGVTHVIYGFRRSDMGERFSIFDINSIWTDDGLNHKIEPELDAEGNAFDSIFSVMSGGFQEGASTKLDKLDPERRLCWGLLNHYIEHIEDTGVGCRAIASTFGSDRTLKLEIDALAVWLEHGRCNLPSKNDPYTIMTPAEPHRSIKILSKYALALAIVFQLTAPTPEIRRLLRKLAFDTAKGKALEIMNFVATHPLISKKLLAGHMKISDTWCGVWCDHLISLGVLQELYKPNSTGGPGRQTLCYQLTQRFRMYADIIGLHERTLSAKPVSGLSAVLQKHMPFGRKV